MLVSCFARKKEEEEIKNFVEIIFRYQGILLYFIFNAKLSSL
jgi:hypothetical protein